MIERASNKMTRDEGSGATTVEARGVEKTYQTGGATVRALRVVDLSIPRDEMVAVTLLTTFLPTRRASGVYPAEALRYE